MNLERNAMSDARPNWEDLKKGVEEYDEKYLNNGGWSALSGDGQECELIAPEGSNKDCLVVARAFAVIGRV